MEVADKSTAKPESPSMPADSEWPDSLGILGHFA
jgi:hypothetical protein